MYDRNSRAQTIESENDENKFNRRFIIEPPLLFQKIEFFCNNNVVNNMTTINFSYNTINAADNELYGRSITAKSYHGKHIICNDSEMSIEYDILKYFLQVLCKTEIAKDTEKYLKSMMTSTCC